jgi:hypothetical protein
MAAGSVSQRGQSGLDHPQNGGRVHPTPETSVVGRVSPTLGTGGGATAPGGIAYSDVAITNRPSLERTPQQTTQDHLGQRRSVIIFASDTTSIPAVAKRSRTARATSRAFGASP